MKILAVIPARGGSKGIPKKNVREFNGKPLIAWTIEQALNSPFINKVIVSTDSPEIANISNQYGAETPFLREMCLSEDDTPGFLPIIDAVNRTPGFDWVLTLQPTSPLRTVSDIDGIITHCHKMDSKSAVAVVEVSSHPSWSYTINDLGSLCPFTDLEDRPLRRQELEKVYVPNGAMYLSTCESLFRERSLIPAGTKGYIMPKERSIDIDDIVDWDIAEFMIRRASK